MIIEFKTYVILPELTTEQFDALRNHVLNHSSMVEIAEWFLEGDRLQILTDCVERKRKQSNEN